MRRALLLLPLLLVIFHPLGVAGPAEEAQPILVSGPLLTPPNPAVDATPPFVLQVGPQPVSVRPAQATEELVAVLVDFPDQTAIRSPGAIEDLLFDAAPGTSSLHAFYRETSYNATQIVGATTNDWYRMGQTMTYYGEDGSG
ncbi:MAG: hypothetical protein V3U17_06345, partial [Thermoplasmata archaeon]